MTTITVELRELLERLRQLCDYWFVQGQGRGLSESEWKTWHSLGFGSKVYLELRALLAEQPQAE